MRISFAMGWLFATALVIGLGLGPALEYYASADSTAFTHGTENDVIWLATGIFVSIVNIFLSLLNLFSE